MNAYATSAALDDDSPALGIPADDDAERTQERQSCQQLGGSPAR